MVFTPTTTWLFRAGPLVTLVAIPIASLLIPLGPFASPVGFTGDFVLFAYLFGLANILHNNCGTGHRILI